MAATVPAVCSAERWSYNTLNQSPCVVGSALKAVCQPGASPIVYLPPGYVYDGPSLVDRQNTPCRCSSVYYSLLSACAWCQGRDFISWSRYATNCTTAYLGVFPRELPRGTGVPAWAYMNVTVHHGFLGPCRSPGAQRP
ncbi:hypothetical protein FA13DRAFT_555351 [Coprinellus micaceus]|uniref:Uncharacterized protein n=1 Tax=Coprinellus micaceus TaxID=71717 RepID=A0A4Y7T8M5_COPMI|nr:hypothetical protein FA13DRAFT_555351 [Coprinellus micaceus]